MRRKVKEHMYFSDPRHPNHKEFLKLCRSGPDGSSPKKSSKVRPNYSQVNIFGSGANRPKYSYVLSEHVRKI